MAKSNHDLVMEAIAILDADDDEFVTDEWLETHEQFFREIRDCFKDFNDVNLDIRDIDFRRAATQAELYARDLERNFEVYKYCQLCKICYDLYLACAEESGDLTSAFGNMNVGKK